MSICGVKYSQVPKVQQKRLKNLTWGIVKGSHLDILDLRLVSIRAFRRPNVIVLGMSLSLEPSKRSTLGLLIM